MPRRGYAHDARQLKLKKLHPNKSYMVEVYMNKLESALDECGQSCLSWLLQVMEAEQARTRSEAEHKKTAANYNSCISHMRQLEKKLKRSINKSRCVLLFPSWTIRKDAHELHPTWASLCVRKRAKEGLRLCHLMQSRCWLCWLCSVGVCSLRKSQGMRLLTEECFYSNKLSSDSSFSFSPCRPYFELKAKYYLQLEVCILH